MQNNLGRAFASRARREREATLRFARLAVEFEAVGAGLHWAGLAREAAEDEARHAVLCDAFAQSHGVAQSAGLEHHGSVAPPELSRADALLYDVIATCCVAETVNVALLTAEFAAAREPALRRLTTQLLRDEVKHSRLGWAYLAEVAAHRDVTGLRPHLSAMLCHANDEADAAGEAGPAVRRALWVLSETMNGVVLPGLALHGLRQHAPEGG